MKKIYAALLCLPVFAGAVTYSGNGNSGFGGVIGTGTLDITEDATNIYFSLSKGSGNVNDIIVLYLDTKSGGFSTTASFTDAGDNLRKAISGFDGGTRATLNFITNFTADYAMAIRPISPDNGGRLLELVNNGAHIDRGSVSLTPNNSQTSGTYTFQIAKSSVVLSGSNVSFNFLATLISNTAFRANEFMGYNFSGGNPGTSTVNTNTVFRFPSATLLPVTLTSFTGAVKNNTVNHTWKTATENNLSHFEIEQSTDGRSWLKAGVVAGVNSANGANYQYEIQNVTASFMLYRLKITDKDGRSAYSQQVTIKKSGKAGIELIGNPVKDVVRLAIHQPESATFNAEIISLNGRRISNTIYQHNGGSAVYNINIPAVAPGMYLIKVSSATSKETFKVLVN